MTPSSRSGGIGLYGGTFDPPHVGHVALARAAIRELDLVALHVVPCGEPAHRPSAGASGRQRLDMLRQVMAVDGRMEVDDRELRRRGPSYTFDTVRELCALHDVARVWMVLGEDAAAGLPGWHRVAELLARVDIALARRALDTGANADSGWRDLAARHGAAVRNLNVVPPDISSTRVRAALAAGESVEAMLEAPVRDYVHRHRLYRNAVTTKAGEA